MQIRPTKKAEMRPTDYEEARSVLSVGLFDHIWIRFDWMIAYPMRLLLTETSFFQQSTRNLSIWNPIGRARLICLRKHFCDPRRAKMKLSYRRNTFIDPLGWPQDFVFKPFQCDLFRLSGTNQPASPSDIAQLCKHSLAHEYCIRDFLISVCG